MAEDLEVGELNPAAPLTGAELLHVVQGGNSVRATAQALADLLIEVTLGGDADFAQATLTALANRVRVDVNDQGLTAAQKLNAQTNLSLVPGTDVQPYDGTLQALAGTTVAADTLLYANGPDSFATTSLSAYARTLLDDANAAAAKATLGLVIGTDVQAQNTNLQSFSALAGVADRIAYFTGVGTLALATLTSTARSLLDDTSTTAMRTTLGLTIGTNVQAYDATLQAISGVVTAADKLLYATGVDTFATTDFSAFARSLLDDADAATMRATLGVYSTAQVDAAISAVVGAAPEALNALNELAAAIGNDPNFSASMATSLGNRLRIDVSNQGLTAGQKLNAQTNIGLVPGVDVQAYDATLAGLAAVATAADRLIYATAADTFAATVFTSFARTLLDDADAAAAQATLSLVPGTHVQAYSALLAGLAGLGASTGILEQTGAATFTKRAIGVAAATSLLTRGDGDGRYAALTHTHTASEITDFSTAAAAASRLAVSKDGVAVGDRRGINFTGGPSVNLTVTDDAANGRVNVNIDLAATVGVSSFNTRTGAVTLTGADVTAALGYTPASTGANTYGGTQTFSPANAYCAVFDRATGLERAIAWRTGGVNRWTLAASAGTESGANVASDLQLKRWADDGSLLSTCLTVNRASGVFDFQSMPKVGGTTLTDRANTWTADQTLASGGDLLLDNGGKIIFRATDPSTRPLRRLVHPVAWGDAGGTVTGAVVFETPVAYGLMIQATVKGFAYSNIPAESLIDFDVQSYKSSDAGAFDRLNVSHRGGLRPMVRWARTPGGKTALIIGDVTSAWVYTHIAMVSALLSYSLADDAAELAGAWTSSLVTDLTGYTNVTADLNTTANSSLPAVANTWTEDQTLDSAHLLLKNGSKLITSNGVDSGNGKARIVTDAGQYQTGVALETGAIVFKGGASNANGRMLLVDVMGYNHDGTGKNQQFAFTATAYRTTGAYSRQSVAHQTSFRPMVRWASAPDGSDCLIIGDTTTQWEYAHLAIAKVMASYSGAMLAAESIYGWTASLVTDLTGYGNITSDLTSAAGRGVQAASNTWTEAQTIKVAAAGVSPLRLESDQAGASAIADTMPGMELIVGSMNATSKYGLGLKFMSDDAELNGGLPKFLAAIIPTAAETFAASTDGGTHLEFFTSPVDPGAGSVPTLGMRLYASGDLAVLGSLGLGQVQTPSSRLTITQAENFSAGDVSDRTRGSIHLASSAGSATDGNTSVGVSFSGISTSRRRAAVAAYQHSGAKYGLVFYGNTTGTTTTDAVEPLARITPDRKIEVANGSGGWAAVGGGTPAGVYSLSDNGLTPGVDGTVALETLATTVAAAGGGVIYVPINATAWRFDDLVDLAGNVYIEGGHRDLAVMDFSQATRAFSPNTGVLFWSGGNSRTWTKTISVALAKGQNYIPVDATSWAGITVDHGTTLHLTSSQDYLPGAETTLGEFVQVRYVDTANNLIYLTSPLRFNYPTGYTVKIGAAPLVQAGCEGVTLKGRGTNPAGVPTGLTTFDTAAAYKVYGYMLAPAQTLPNGAEIFIKPHVNSGASPTLEIFKGAVKPLYGTDGTTPVASGALVAGTVYRFIFNATTQRWVQQATLGTTGQYSGTAEINDASSTSRGDTGLHFRYCRDVYARDLRIRGLENYGVFLESCYSFDVENVSFQFTPIKVRSQYGVAAYRSTSNGRVSGCNSVNDRHFFTTGATAAPSIDAHYGIPSDITVSGNTCEGSWQSAVDSHRSGINMIFTANTSRADQAGIKTRNDSTNISANTCTGPVGGSYDADGGIMAFYAVEGLSIIGNRTFGFMRGIRIDSLDPGYEEEFSIVANRCDSADYHGISINENAAADLTDIVLADNIVRGCGENQIYIRRSTGITVSGGKIKGKTAGKALVQLYDCYRLAGGGVQFTFPAGTTNTTGAWDFYYTTAAQIPRATICGNQYDMNGGTGVAYRQHNATWTNTTTVSIAAEMTTNGQAAVAATSY